MAVTTRRKAKEAHQDAQTSEGAQAESSAQRTRQTSHQESTATSRSERQSPKEMVPESEENAMPLLRRLKRRPRQQTPRDEHEDDAPSSKSGFYDNIMDRALGKRRVRIANPEEDAKQQMQLEVEAERNRHSEEARDEAAADELAHEEDNEDSDDELPPILEDKHDSGLIAKDIMSFKIINDDMAYIKPQLAGDRPPIVKFSCSKSRRLLELMGDKEWTDKGDGWDDAITPSHDNEEMVGTMAQAPLTKTQDCIDVCIKAVSWLREFCSELPKMPRLEDQCRRLAQRSDDLQQVLYAIRRCVRKICFQAARFAPPKGCEVDQNKMVAHYEEFGKYYKIIDSIRGHLIPALTLALDEAFALGGSRADAPSQDGLFIACTLQIALRIVGFMSRLCAATEDGKDLGSEHRVFADLLATQRADLLRNMEELQDKAYSRLERLTKEQRVVGQRRYQQRKLQECDERIALIKAVKAEGFGRQKQRAAYGGVTTDNQKLVEVIRKQPSPDFEYLAQRFPHKSTAELQAMVSHLRQGDQWRPDLSSREKRSSAGVM